jgi:alkylation response protein AidB-like acyl-CoA dehydrogenase
MALSITDDHRALAETVEGFLARNGSLAAARALLEADEEAVPPFFAQAAALGWLGLHVDEEHGGSGFGLEELVVVAEQLGRFLAPGPFLPTLQASAVLAAAGDTQTKQRYLPGLSDGSIIGAVARGGDVEMSDQRFNGSAGVVLGAGFADVLLVPVGDDVAVIDVSASGVSVTVPKNLDPTRRAGRVELDGASGILLGGARQALVDLTRLILAAEATGIAVACTEQAAEYAKSRQQFGRPIAMFQAVKHHCANMAVATELATAAVWDGARAAATGGEQLSLASAMAASLALAAADLCANLNTQVHGGIGMTWEHDAHLYLRRATAMEAILDAEAAAVATTGLTRDGVRRSRSVDLPPEAEAIRDTVKAFVAEIAGRDRDQRRAAMIETGYAMPHWPAPWGRDAGAVEQLVIEQELEAAGIRRPSYGITGWIILTLIQHATEDQVARWVRPALDQEVIWCQLFSEPDAGSDAAGIKTRATRVDGGWLVNGQKVWTSGAHLSKQGFATVRTNPDVPKHSGITIMVIDMEAEGVEVRPIKMPSGNSEFNEVFFNDVFVPDDDVVGKVDDGWTVARATLGNESVSIGSGSGGLSMPGEMLIPYLDAHPERLSGGAGRVGRYIATHEAIGAMNLRSAHRAVAGGGPGPEGNVTKLVLSEIGHDAAAIIAACTGSEGAFVEGPGAMVAETALSHRALSIAGGTSEIKRNQIGERILGLPRDPLIK